MPRGIPNSGERRQSRRNTAGKTGQQWGAKHTKQLQRIQELVSGLAHEFGGSNRGRSRMTGTRGRTGKTATTGTRQQRKTATG